MSILFTLNDNRAFGYFQTPFIKYAFRISLIVPDGLERNRTVILAESMNFDQLRYSLVEERFLREHEAIEFKLSHFRLVVHVPH